MAARGERVRWERAYYDGAVQSATVAGVMIVVRPREPDRGAWLACVGWRGETWSTTVWTERRAKRHAIGMAKTLAKGRGR